MISRIDILALLNKSVWRHPPEERRHWQAMLNPGFPKKYRRWCHPVSKYGKHPRKMIRRNG